VSDQSQAEAVRWMRVNDEPFEYAIQQGRNGDEFVKLLNGTCLRRPIESPPQEAQDGLLPCPFCGREPTVVDIDPHSHKGGIAAFMPDHSGSSYIECGCGAGLIDDDRKAVIARWNARASPSQGSPSPEREALEPTGKVHHLKTWPPYFDEVSIGLKPFEWRIDDRDFKIGDTLILQEYIPNPENPGREGQYTGREITKLVSYIFSPWPTNKRTVVMALTPRAVEKAGELDYE
jgi:hypothetical protein